MIFKPFIDILYSIAIGIGFSKFPNNPFKDFYDTLFFLATLLIATQDWFEFHNKFDSIANGYHKFWYNFIQVLSILFLSQMFRHSTSDPQSWLGYLGCFLLLGSVWTIITPIKNQWVFIFSAVFQGTANILLVIFFKSICVKFQEIGLNAKLGILLIEMILISLSYTLIFRFNR